MTRRRTLTPLAFALAFLSCHPDGSVGRGRVPGIRVRVRIWNAAGVVIYDNQPGVSNDAWTVTPLGGGNISVKERGGTHE